MTEKKALRADYLSRRNTLTAAEQAEKSRCILTRLQNITAFFQAELLLTYVDFGSEVRTAPLITELLQKKEKRIFCPRVNGPMMDFYEITALDQLESGYRGIREPKLQPEFIFGEEQYRRYQCLVLMPGVVFDRSCGRIGYGKGYYDRFLTLYPNLPTIALAYDCQLAPAIPLAAHDIRPDIVITEREIIIV